MRAALSFLVICTLSGMVSPAAAFELQWAHAFEAETPPWIFAVAADGNGSIYLGGAFYSVVDFDPGPQVHAQFSALAAYILKLDEDGGFQWVVPIPGWTNASGDSGILITDLAVSPGGNLLVLGLFGGFADLDPGPGVHRIGSASRQDAFVAAYDPGGALLWAQTFDNGGYDQPHRMAFGSGGEIYFTLSTSETDRSYLYKLDSSGHQLWQSTIINAGMASVQVAPGDKLFLAGAFRDTLQISPQPGSIDHLALHSAGWTDVFIAVLDSNGRVWWTGSIGGIGGDYLATAAADAAGNLVLAGSFDETADFDPGDGTRMIEPMGDKDAFIARVDLQGELQWVWAVGSPHGYAVEQAAAVVDPMGNSLCAITLRDDAILHSRSGHLILPQSAERNIYTLQIAASGTPSRHGALASSNEIRSSRLAGDSFGNLYIAGVATVAMDADPTSGEVTIHAPSGREASFVVKLATEGWRSGR